MNLASWRRIRRAAKEKRLWVILRAVWVIQDRHFYRNQFKMLFLLIFQVSDYIFIIFTLFCLLCLFCHSAKCPKFNQVEACWWCTELCLTQQKNEKHSFAVAVLYLKVLLDTVQYISRKSLDFHKLPYKPESCLRYSLRTCFIYIRTKLYLLTNMYMKDKDFNLENCH